MSSLREMIETELADRDPISFARFMQLALYGPKLGFYERFPAVVGPQGAFLTSVSVGRLLGRLLAFQFVRWLAEFTGKERALVEAGAHQGLLARDILDYFKAFAPELYGEIYYDILEPSEPRRAWQEQTLQEHRERVRWRKGWDEIPESSLTGVLFSNELLDAFPVHRLGWDAASGQWFEWGVTLADDRFAWARMALVDPDLWNHFGMKIPVEVERVLPDGFVLEISPAAGLWWRRAARSLKEGVLMTLDYGQQAVEFLKPERTGGTLRAYHDHQLGRDPLQRVGEQDLTAHVNFTQLQAEGTRAGLITENYVNQATFLTRIASQTWEAGASFPTWDASQKRQFQTLTHPQHFGALFKVLVQTRKDNLGPAQAAE